MNEKGSKPVDRGYAVRLSGCPHRRPNNDRRAWSFFAALLVAWRESVKMAFSKETVDDYLFRHDMELPFARTLQPHDVKLLSEKAIVVLTLRAIGFVPWQIAKRTYISEEQVEQALRDAKKIYLLTPQVLRALARFADDLDDIETEIFRYVGKVPAGKEVVA